MRLGTLAAKARKEPLVWFLLAGLLLFAVHSLIAPDEDDPQGNLIRIDRDRLLEFVQLRARSFNETAAGQSIDRMSPAEIAAVVEDMAREEALYREALRLGLDRNDYVLRRRLVQSLEYVGDSDGRSTTALDDAALRKFYEANKANYASAPSISFAHVFFSAQLHGRDGARALAEAARARLASGNAESLGDRFLYLQNYADRSSELIGSHFGNAFADAIFKLKAEPDEWQGPLKSVHGYHLVRIVALAKGRPLPFDEARDMVRADAASEQQTQRRRAFVASVLDRYKVDIDSDVRQLMQQAR